jgi:hypothetical protein
VAESVGPPRQLMKPSRRSRGALYGEKESSNPYSHRNGRGAAAEGIAKSCLGLPFVRTYHASCRIDVRSRPLSPPQRRTDSANAEGSPGEARLPGQPRPAQASLPHCPRLHRRVAFGEIPLRVFGNHPRRWQLSRERRGIVHPRPQIPRTLSTQWLTTLRDFQ